MKINEFNLLIAKKEHKKKQVDIAQISEISRVINDITNGDYYRMIRGHYKNPASNLVVLIASLLMMMIAALFIMVEDRNQQIEDLKHQIDYCMTEELPMFMNGEGG